MSSLSTLYFKVRMFLAASSDILRVVACPRSF